MSTQQKLGVTPPQKKIELFSGTYFAACTIGGIIGESDRILVAPQLTHSSLRSHTHTCHTSRCCKDSSSGQFLNLQE